MQERIERLNDVIGSNAISVLLKACSIRIGRTYLNPTPQTFSQYLIKFLLNQFKYLRSKIMTHANNQADIDIYNLQAIEILERAGITEPSEQQITTIERLLKAGA